MARSSTEFKSATKELLISWYSFIAQRIDQTLTYGETVTLLLDALLAFFVLVQSDNRVDCHIR